MADDVIQCLDALKFANKIIGLENTVVLDSGIYDHLYDNNLFNASEDRIEIVGTSESPIELSDVIQAFDKIQTQINKVKKSKYGGRAYFYEGLKCVVKHEIYQIYWGS